MPAYARVKEIHARNNLLTVARRWHGADLQSQPAARRLCLPRRAARLIGWRPHPICRAGQRPEGGEPRVGDHRQHRPGWKVESEAGRRPRGRPRSAPASASRDKELAARDLLSSRMAYVSVSRGAHDAQIFTNDREKLPDALGHEVSRRVRTSRRTRRAVDCAGAGDRTTPRAGTGNWNRFLKTPCPAYLQSRQLGECKLPKAPELVRLFQNPEAARRL